VAAEEARIRIVWPEDALWPQGGYANAFQINHTPWDFTVRMGQMVLPAFDPEQPPPPGTEVEVPLMPVAQVTMPPSAFRELVLALQDQIAKYTATWGPIGGREPGGQPHPPPENQEEPDDDQPE
jgi:Protein of unknown function (DUF3467)